MPIAIGEKELLRIAQVRADALAASNERIQKRGGGRFEKGNKVAVKHGAYATAFVSDEEMGSFLAIRQEIAREFKKEIGPDTPMLDAAALLYIRHGNAMCSGEVIIANQIMASILAMLDRLKATKSTREGSGVVDAPKSASEWAAELLSDDPPADENKKKMSDNTEDDTEDTPF